MYNTVKLSDRLRLTVFSLLKLFKWKEHLLISTKFILHTSCLIHEKKNYIKSILLLKIFLWIIRISTKIKFQYISLKSIHDRSNAKSIDIVSCRMTLLYKSMYVNYFTWIFISLLLSFMYYTNDFLIKLDLTDDIKVNSIRLFRYHIVSI